MHTSTQFMHHIEAWPIILHSGLAVKIKPLQIQGPGNKAEHKCNKHRHPRINIHIKTQDATQNNEHQQALTLDFINSWP